jgi:hypothetical protein
MKPIVAVIVLVGVVFGQGGGRQDTEAPQSIAAQAGIQSGELSPGDPNAEKRARENHKKNVEETDKLIELAMELRADLSQQNALTVSATTSTKTAKEAEQIKKLADSIWKRIKSQ